MTYEQIVGAFEQLYPTQFRHVVAELRAAEAEAKLAEYEKEDAVEPSDDGSGA